MKYIYTLLLLLITEVGFSQFVHMRPNQEAPEQVELVMNDGTTRTGNVKNNKMDYVALRILSQDASAFRHASVEVDYVQFKPEGASDYIKVPTKDIKHILFQGEEPKRFDRINVYRINKRKLEVKSKEPALMIQTPIVDDFLVVYTNLYFNAGRGGSVHDQYNIFVRHKDSDLTYYFNFMAAVKDRHNLAQLKILAPNNKLFSEFIDQLRDKKSAVFKEYYDQEKELMDEVQAYINEHHKKAFSEERRSIQMNAKYRFMFSYISKKLEQFSS